MKKAANQKKITSKIKKAKNQKKNFVLKIKKAANQKKNQKKIQI